MQFVSFRLCLCLFGALLALGACSGSSSSGVTPASVVPPLAQQGTHGTSGARVSVAQAGCGVRAVFVRLDTEIRGYPLDADGVTLPCTQIAGPQTQLLERGVLAVSVHGALHSLSFQSEFGLTIDRSDANGDALPSRAVRVDQDHVALAVDSHINDFVVASQGYEGDNCWYIVADGQTSAGSTNCDSNLTAIHALATNNRDELIAVGIDATNGQSRIDVFADPATAAPRLVRTISGPATGLPTLVFPQGYFDVSYSLAADPRSGALYVYSHVYNVAGGGTTPGAAPPGVAEFSADADGNVAPLRVLWGPNVPLVQAAFSVNVLSCDDQGNLYVIAPGPSPIVAVYGPDASGNAAPIRRFADPTAAVGFEGASVAVRSVIQ